MTAKRRRLTDPVKICARKHKGWAFMGTMTVGQYREAEDAITKDLEQLTAEAFEAKYKAWMY